MGLRSPSCKIPQKPKFIRQLYRFAARTSTSLFLKTLQRALSYQISSMASLERIAAQMLQRELPGIPEAPGWEPYEERQTYQQGRFSSEADLATYQRLLEDPNA